MIVMVFGILGVALYLGSDPMHTIFTLLTGYFASFLFMFACSSLSIDSPTHALVFKEL